MLSLILSFRPIFQSFTTTIVVLLAQECYEVYTLHTPFPRILGLVLSDFRNKPHAAKVSVTLSKSVFFHDETHADVV